MKQHLLDKHRHINVDFGDWYEGVETSFRENMSALGIAVEKIYFSGFCSQGDGACFEGALVDPVLYLDKHHPGEFPLTRKVITDWGGGFSVGCKHIGRYYHAGCTEFTVCSDSVLALWDTPSDLQEAVAERLDQELSNELDKLESAMKDTWRGYMQELYSALEQEYDWLTSDEEVWEAIVANELDEEEHDET